MKTQEAWGPKIAAYLFVSGTGAGAYAVGAVCRLLGPEWRGAADAGLVLGPLLVGPATLFLIWDLGRPAGFMRAGRRPGSSWISRGVGILTSFLVVSIAHVALGVWPLAALGRADAVVSLVGVSLAVLTMVYTGLLLGAVRPIPFWSTPIVPVLFLVSSLSTGLMSVDLVLTASHAFLDSAGGEIAPALRATDLLLLAIEAIVLACYLGANQPTATGRASTALVTGGALAPYFWGGVAACGIVVPFAIQLVEVAAGVSGPLALTALSTASGLAGGFMLRHVVVAAGTKAPLVAAGMAFTIPSRAPVERA